MENLDETRGKREALACDCITLQFLFSSSEITRLIKADRENLLMLLLCLTFYSNEIVSMDKRARWDQVSSEINSFYIARTKHFPFSFDVDEHKWVGSTCCTLVWANDWMKQRKEKFHQIAFDAQHFTVVNFFEKYLERSSSCNEALRHRQAMQRAFYLSAFINFHSSFDSIRRLNEHLTKRRSKVKSWSYIHWLDWLVMISKLAQIEFEAFSQIDFISSQMKRS